MFIVHKRHSFNYKEMIQNNILIILMPLKNKKKGRKQTVTAALGMKMSQRQFEIKIMCKYWGSSN